MENISFMRFLNNMIMNHDSHYNGKWVSPKFRFMYILRCLIYPVNSFKYYCDLLHIINEIIRIQPILPAKIHRPYLHNRGSVKERRINIINHYRFVQEFPGKYKSVFLPEKDFCLIEFTGKNKELFKVHCSPCGFDREGELMLSLHFNGIPVSRISFSVIQTKAGNAAFIGGLQGPAKGTGTDIIRCATKSCYGLFPKRIIFEVFGTLISACGINEVLAVSEHSHVFRQFRYRYQKRKTFVAKYSDFWDAVGGVKYNGLYKLPVQVKRKALCEIVSKKRAEYRKRYALLDCIREKLLSIFG